jgi:hypothetical protein
LVARQIATKPQFADAPQTRVERPKVEPLSPSRYKIQFTASEALRDKLERLQALAPSADLADVIEAAVTEKLERAEAKRCGKTAKPKTTLEDADTSRGARGIPAAVRREVWARDGARCTFVSSSAKRCTERHRLELHHDEPFALGGDRSTRNIRLLCRAHNALMAELDFGSETMNAFRVREPSPAFDWTPTPVRPVSPRSRQSREA